MSIPESKLGRDFILAEPDDPLGYVVRQLMDQNGSDYTFLLVRRGARSFWACPFGRLKRRLKSRSKKALFAKRLSQLRADFSEVPAVQRDELDLAAAQLLARANPLRLVVVLEGEVVLGYIWLASRTVYPGASLIESYQAMLQQSPPPSEQLVEKHKKWMHKRPVKRMKMSAPEEGPEKERAEMEMSAPEDIEYGMEEATSVRAEPPAAKNVVNTGFTLRSEPKVLLDKTRPLAPASAYYFILGVGEVIPETIEVSPTPLPEDIPAQAVLQVALFSFAGEIEIDPQASLGLLRLQEDGSAVILRQPGEPADAPEVPYLLFPVKTPERTGRMRLRCNIYYRQCLVQSRLVSAQVYPAGAWTGDGLP